MARINGVNSDYKKGVSGNIEESKESPLFVKIFICPHEQPTSLEQANGPVCVGTNADCPSPDKAGHAKLELHETEGAKLVAGAGSSIVLEQTGGNILLNPVQDVKVKNVFSIKINGNQVSLEAPGGSKIVLQSNGNVDIFTNGNAGDVTVHGNLKYTGTLTKG